MAPHASPFHVPSLQENKDEYHDKWREKAMATQAELLRKYNKHAAKFRRKKGVKKKAVVVQQRDSDEESESEDMFGLGLPKPEEIEGEASRAQGKTEENMSLEEKIATFQKRRKCRVMYTSITADGLVEGIAKIKKDEEEYDPETDDPDFDPENEDYLPRRYVVSSLQIGTKVSRKRTDKDIKAFDDLLSRVAKELGEMAEDMRRFKMVSSEERYEALLIEEGVLKQRKQRILNLGVRVDDDSAVRLGMALTSANWLERLNLNHSNIGGTGIQAILTGIRKNENSRLMELRLDKNNIGEAGAYAMAAFLKDNSTLVSCDL